MLCIGPCFLFIFVPIGRSPYTIIIWDVIIKVRICLIHKCQNAPVPHSTIPNSKQKCAHVFFERSNMGYGTCALCDLRNWSHGADEDQLCTLKVAYIIWHWTCRTEYRIQQSKSYVVYMVSYWDFGIRCFTDETHAAWFLYNLYVVRIIAKIISVSTNGSKSYAYISKHIGSTIHFNIFFFQRWHISISMHYKMNTRLQQYCSNL